MQSIPDKSVGTPQVCVDADLDAYAVSVAESVLDGTNHIAYCFWLTEQIRSNVLRIRPWLRASAVQINAVDERTHELGGVG